MGTDLQKSCVDVGWSVAARVSWGPEPAVCALRASARAACPAAAPLPVQKYVSVSRVFSAAAGTPCAPRLVGESVWAFISATLFHNGFLLDGLV